MPAKRWRHAGWKPCGDDEGLCCASRGPFYALIRIFNLLCAAVEGERARTAIRRRGEDQESMRLETICKVFEGLFSAYHPLQVICQKIDPSW
jgi:hypothetical protein